MTHTTNGLAFLSLIACTSLTSCGLTKKVIISQSTATSQNASIYPWNTNNVNYVPFPPEEIEKKFNLNYPLAVGISWTIEISSGVLNTKNITGYKVNFFLDKQKNSVVYAENGHRMESREQILPEQLPSSIYDAIKGRFPNAHIVSASSVTNSRINGAYAAVIQTIAPDEEREVILMENGVFVQ